MIEINKIYNYLCLDGMKKLPNKSIDCIITSPPYWQLRDYGFTNQWGLEPTYQEYLEHLWQFMDEAYKVLKDDGTCWINLGDSYYGSGKCLLLLPHRFAIGCIDRGWILRNDIIWAKRNGMPESVIDRFSKKHEFIFFFVKQKKYFFGLDSIRDQHCQVSIERSKRKYTQTKGVGLSVENLKAENMCHENGKNPGDVSDFWDITTKGSSDKHYASYNSKLIIKPILAGCPENGIVVDPFCGVGTTLLTAYKLNRNFMGFDGNSEYCDIVNKKISEIKNNLFENIK